MKETITNLVKELCLKANVPVIVPEFTIKGKVAGRFFVKQGLMGINFNLILAETNDNFVNRTPVHEVAHYVRYYRNGRKHDMNGKKRDIHGAKWKAVMKELGATDSTRCHSYDMSNIKQRKYNKFAYQCHAGHYYELTAIKHNKVVKGTAEYLCRECDSTLHFQQELGVV